MHTDFYLTQSLSEGKQETLEQFDSLDTLLESSIEDIKKMYGIVNAVARRNPKDSINKVEKLYTMNAQWIKHAPDPSFVSYIEYYQGNLCDPLYEVLQTKIVIEKQLEHYTNAKEQSLLHPNGMLLGYTTQKVANTYHKLYTYGSPRSIYLEQSFENHKEAARLLEGYDDNSAAFSYFQAGNRAQDLARIHKENKRENSNWSKEAIYFLNKYISTPATNKREDFIETAQKSIRFLKTVIKDIKKGNNDVEQEEGRKKKSKEHIRKLRQHKKRYY